MPLGFGIVGIPRRGGGPLVKPAPGTPIATQHPLAQGLRAFWMCDSLGRVVSATGIGHGTPASGIAVASGRGGRALNLTTAGHRVDGIGNPAPLQVDSEVGAGVTLCALYNCTTLPTGVEGDYQFGAIVGAGYLSDRTGYGLYLSATSYVFQPRNGGTTANASAAHGGETGVWRHLVGTRKAGATILYRDGALLASNTTAAISGGTVPTAVWSIGQRAYVTINWLHQFRGLIEHAGMWARVLNDSEAHRLNAEPYCMFWERRRTIFVPTGTGGDQSLIVGTATCVVTSHDATIAASGSAPFPVTAATCAVTAHDATIAASGSVAFSVTAATCSVTAHDATIASSGSAPFPVTAATCSVTVHDVTLAASGSVTFPVTTATCSVTAHDAAFTATGSVSFAVTAATCVVTAHDVTLEAGGATFSVGTATCSVTAHDPGITASGSAPFPVSTATCVVTAHDVTLTATGTASFPVEAAACSVTVHDATFVSGGSVFQVGAATCSVTAHDATFTSAGSAPFPVTAATCTVTAHDATLTASGSAAFSVTAATCTVTAHDAVFSSMGLILQVGVATCEVTAHDVAFAGIGAVLFPVDVATCIVTAHDATLSVVLARVQSSSTFDTGGLTTSNFDSGGLAS